MARQVCRSDETDGELFSSELLRIEPIYAKVNIIEKSIHVVLSCREEKTMAAQYTANVVLL